MNRLLEIGFEPTGHWRLEGDDLVFVLKRHANQRNILYAFVCDGVVMYVGKTVQPLATRLTGYRRPGKTQTTNINNNHRIRELLVSGAAVEILALPDSGLMHYGRFHLNLAAGFEDDLIRVIDPEWNGGRKEKPEEGGTCEPAVRTEQHAGASFELVLQPTYHRTGFFNVGVAHQALFGEDGEQIEFYLDESPEPIHGMINRTANGNRTPRVMVVSVSAIGSRRPPNLWTGSV